MRGGEEPCFVFGRCNIDAAIDQSSEKLSEQFTVGVFCCLIIRHFFHCEENGQGAKQTGSVSLNLISIYQIIKTVLQFLAEPVELGINVRLFQYLEACDACSH